MGINILLLLSLFNGPISQGGNEFSIYHRAKCKLDSSLAAHLDTVISELVNLDYDQSIHYQKTAYYYHSNRYSAKSVYSYQQTWYLKTRNLRSEQTSFHDCVTGYTEYYDDPNAPDLKRELNCNSAFSFSIDSLCVRFWKDYKIDLLTRHPGMQVSRTEVPAPIYHVRLPAKDGSQTRTLIIDGLNGKVLSDTLLPIEK